jgi:hypothetical protein
LQQQLFTQTGEELLDTDVVLGAGLEEAPADVSRPISCFDGVDCLKCLEILLVADNCDDCR